MTHGKKRNNRKTTPKKEGSKKNAVRKKKSTAPLTPWKILEGAKDRVKAVTEHFSILCDDKEDLERLELVAKMVSAIKIDKDHLLLEFQNGFELKASAPLKRRYDHLPKSLSRILGSHESLILANENDHLLALDAKGSFDKSLLKDAETELTELHREYKNINIPLEDGQNWWMLHPEEKNGLGESRVYFVDHGSLALCEPQSGNIGSIFLRRLSDHLKLVRSTKKESGKTGYSSSLRPEKDATFGYGFYLALKNGRILKLTRDGISIITWKNDQFDLGEPLLLNWEYKDRNDPFLAFLYPHAREVDHKKVIIRMTYYGYLFLDVSGEKPVLIYDIKDEKAGTGVNVVGNNIFCFDSEKKSFIRIPLASPSNQSLMFPFEDPRIYDSIRIGDDLLFVGQDKLIGASILSTNESITLKKLFSSSVNYFSPAIEHVEESNLFIVFDNEIAATIYVLEKNQGRLLF